MRIYTSNNLFRFLVILVLVLFPALLMAGEYTIKKGDTLWDISEEKMKDPFLWHELWKANPHIKNPHLIFPGQKLNIPSEVTEQEKKDIHEQVESVSKKAEKATTTAKVVSKKEIPILKKNYLVSKTVLLQSGYISDDISSEGKISVSPLKQILMGRGDYVYIDTDKPANINDKFYIISIPEKVIHPKTDTDLGYLIRINGLLQVVGEDNGIKKAMILESYNEIFAGEMLTAFYPVELPVEPDKESRPAINGTIIRMWDKYNMSGTGDIVYLDKGLANGVKIGDVFNIIASEKPNVTIGMLQIISVKDKTSAAIVKKATSEIKTGDLFKN